MKKKIWETSKEIFNIMREMQAKSKIEILSFNSQNGLYHTTCVGEDVEKGGYLYNSDVNTNIHIHYGNYLNGSSRH